jgi:hypothetical protein
MMYEGLKYLADPTKHIRSKGRDQTEVGATVLLRGSRWHTTVGLDLQKVGSLSRRLHILLRKSSRETKTNQSKEVIINKFIRGMKYIAHFFETYEAALVGV